MNNKEPINTKNLRFDYPRTKTNMKVSNIKVTSKYDYNFASYTGHEIHQYLSKLYCIGIMYVLSPEDGNCYLQALNAKPHGYTWWHKAVCQIMHSEQQRQEKSLDQKNMIAATQKKVDMENELTFNQKLLQDKIALLFLSLDVQLEALTLRLQQLSSTIPTEECDTIIKKIIGILNDFDLLTQYKNDKECTNLSNQFKIFTTSELITLATCVKNTILNLRTIDNNANSFEKSFEKGLSQDTRYSYNIKITVAWLSQMRTYFSWLKIPGKLSTTEQPLPVMTDFWTDHYKSLTTPSPLSFTDTKIKPSM